MADEHQHGPGGPGQGGPGQGGGVNQQQMLQVFQQKIGNLELTVNALIGVLIEEDMIDQEELNEKAQEIVEQIQEQQGAEGPAPEDIADQLED